MGESPERTKTPLISVSQRDFIFIVLLIIFGGAASLVAFYGKENVFLFPMGLMFVWFVWSAYNLWNRTQQISSHLDKGHDLPERLAGTIIPPSFTALGILFTFLGLLYGLSDFSTKPEHLLSSISTLVLGTQAAFLSSVLGIAFSVLTSQTYQYLWKRYEDKKQHIILQNAVHDAVAVSAPGLLMNQPELALLMLLRETQSSNEKLGALVEVMTDEDRQRRQLESLMEHFADSFTKQLGAKFEKMESVLDKFIAWNESSKDLYDASQKQMAAFHEQSEKLLESQNKILTEQTAILSELSASASTLSTVSGSLEQTVGELKTQNRNLVDIKTSSDDLLAKITDRLEQLQSIAANQNVVTEKQGELLTKITSLEEGFKRTYEELSNNTRVLNETLERETKLVDILNGNLEEQSKTSAHLQQAANTLEASHRCIESLPADLEKLQGYSASLLSRFEESLEVVQTSLAETEKTSRAQGELLTRLEAAVAGLGNLEAVLGALSSSNDKILTGLTGLAEGVSADVEKVSTSSNKLGANISAFDQSLGKLNTSMETVGSKIPTQFAELEGRNAVHLETISEKTVAMAHLLEELKGISDQQIAVGTSLEMASKNLSGLDDTFKSSLDKLSGASRTIADAVSGLRQDLDNVSSAREGMAKDLGSIGSSLGDISNAMSQLENLKEGLAAINKSLHGIFDAIDDETAKISRHFIDSQRSLQHTIEDLEEALSSYQNSPEVVS